MQGAESVSSTITTLQNVASLGGFLRAAATGAVPLLEHLKSEFLREYNVLAPCKRGRTRVHKPPGLFRGFLHCYYENVYGTRPIAHELQNPLVWRCCGFDRPPSRDAADRFLTGLEHVADEVFDHLVEQAALRGLLDSTYRIDSTHAEAIQWNDEVSWSYGSTAEEHYCGFGYTIVSMETKIPIAAEFTQTKQASEKATMRVTRDALAVDTPIWIIDDGAYDTLQWHDFSLDTEVVPVAPYNLRDTDEPLSIEYRIGDQVEEHSKDLQLKQSVLEEMYSRRTQVERANGAVKDCGPGHIHARGRVHARAQVFLALCLRLVVAITSGKRDDSPERKMLRAWGEFYDTLSLPYQIVIRQIECK